MTISHCCLRRYRLYEDGDYLHIDDEKGNTVAIPGAVVPRLAGDILRGMDNLELVTMFVYLRTNAPALARLLGVGPSPHLRHTLPAEPEVDVGALKELGKEWEKGNRHRIYFDPLQGWYGLRIERNAQGAVATIRLRGQPITEDEATLIIERFREAKLYYDLADRSFHGVALWQEDFEFIVEQIHTLERENAHD